MCTKQNKNDTLLYFTCYTLLHGGVLPRGPPSNKNYKLIAVRANSNTALLHCSHLNVCLSEIHVDTTRTARRRGARPTGHGLATGHPAATPSARAHRDQSFPDDPGRAPTPAPARPARVLAQQSARMGRIKIHNPRLQTAQGHHPGKRRHLISDGRQQLAVKAAESTAEGVPLDWVRVDLQGVALQGHHEDAPAL